MTLQTLDFMFYAISSALQLGAMVFALRMSRVATRRGPWMVLFAALTIMFAFRVWALMASPEVRQQAGSAASLVISALLLVFLFQLRTITLAERASQTLARQRAAERDESEGRYRSLVELSPDVLFVHDGQQILYANAAAVRFFGATEPEQLVGRSPLDLAMPEARTMVQDRIARLKRDGRALPPAVQLWHRLDGTVVPVEASGVLVPWKGAMAIQSILRDVSERYRAEQERSRLLDNERAARTAAEAANRMKDEFLATLSHELRTPLTAILGWSQMAQRDPCNVQEVTEGLRVIERAARAQTRIVEDLLDMSRIISGKLRLDVQRIAPIGVVDAAIETIRTSAAAKQIELRTTLDPLAGPIMGDPNRLQQVLWNVLGNAVKFTPRGGRIGVTLARVNSHIEIAISDTGQGIGPEFLPYVFDRFRQADGSTTRRYGGLGLGLAISKHLIELHGGRMRVHSGGEGQGSTFTIDLPISVLAVTDAGPRVHPASTSGSTAEDAGVHPDLSGVSVLLVDDEPDVLKLIQRLLEARHATVTTALSADQALPLVETLRPHVLVSDIGMQNVDGYELLRRVRSLGKARGGNVPAVALTAFARSEDRTRSLLAGYSVHVSKPVEPEELVATVASLAGRTVTGGVHPQARPAGSSPLE